MVLENLDFEKDWTGPPRTGPYWSSHVVGPVQTGPFGNWSKTDEDWFMLVSYAKMAPPVLRVFDI